jgi:hypothetical protein
MARDFALYFADWPTWMDIIGIIPWEDIFNMNIDIIGTF